MEEKEDEIFCSWEDFNRALVLFKNYAKEHNLKFSCVYGIPRGGLVPAVCLSHILKIPLVLNFEAACRDLESGKILIAEDIADTGKTLFPIVQCFKEAIFIFSIFYHGQSVVTPDFSVYEKTDKYVVFPWERSEQ